jgi:putative spermidine/putrescine transport system permease protein
MFAVVNRFNRAYEEAANDLGATSWQRLRHVTLPILLPGIIGVAMGAFTLSYDEYARTTLAIGRSNTLPLEIYALISSASSPVGGTSASLKTSPFLIQTTCCPIARVTIAFNVTEPGCGMTCPIS